MKKFIPLLFLRHGHEISWTKLAQNNYFYSRISNRLIAGDVTAATAQKMHKKASRFIRIILSAFLIFPITSPAYDSGSTGADGAFNPTVDIELLLTPSGIFNFTTVNIPSGVTVTFTKNAGNTPITILASGNVDIAGTIDINGGNTTRTGDADVTGDGLPGIGGPGGFDGGHGGYSSSENDGGHGQGPGGGDSGRDILSSRGCGGAGGGV